MKTFIAALVLGLGTVAVAKEFRQPVNPHPTSLPIPTCDPNAGTCDPGGH